MYCIDCKYAKKVKRQNIVATCSKFKTIIVSFKYDGCAAGEPKIRLFKRSKKC